METITNRVLINLEDYMALVDKVRLLEQQNKEYDKFISDFKTALFEIGNKIIDKSGQWEVKRIIEILNDENDKVKDINYHIKEINNYLEEYINDKTLRDLILSKLIKELKEQPND